MTEHVVAIFDSENAADAAARELENAGISSSAIRRYRPDRAEGAATGTLLAERPKRHLQVAAASGLGCWVKSLPPTPRGQLTRGMRNGMTGAHTQETRF
jgi:hypothetical protein